MINVVSNADSTAQYHSESEVPWYCNNIKIINFRIWLAFFDWIIVVDF